MSAPKIFTLPTDPDAHPSADVEARIQALPPELEALVRAARELEKDQIELMKQYDKLYRDYARVKQELARKDQEIAQAVARAAQSSAQPMVAEEKRKFRTLAAQMYQEVEYLRQVHPLKGILAAKQAELERVKKSLRRIPRGHRDRAGAEAMVKAHVVERDQLIELVEATETRLNQELQQIQDMMEGKDAIAAMGLDLDDSGDQSAEI